MAYDGSLKSVFLFIIGVGMCVRGFFLMISAGPRRHLPAILFFSVIGVGLCLWGFHLADIAPHGSTEALGLAFLLPSIFYVFRCIGSYDDRLCTLQHAAAEKKDE